MGHELILNHPHVILNIAKHADLHTFVCLTRVNRFFHNVLKPGTEAFVESRSIVDKTEFECNSNNIQRLRLPFSIVGTRNLISVENFVNFQYFHSAISSKGFGMSLLPRGLISATFTGPKKDDYSDKQIWNLGNLPLGLRRFHMCENFVTVKDLWINLEQHTQLVEFVLSVKSFSGQIFFPRQLDWLTICIKDPISSGVYIPPLPVLTELHVIVEWAQERQTFVDFFNLETFPMLKSLIVSNKGWWNIKFPETHIINTMKIDDGEIVIKFKR
jgi:hypothetical protein